MNATDAPAERTPSVEVRRRVAVDDPANLGDEWLLTNGLGGFAFGTVLGANTRRYHGWLIAARRPPVGRVVALHSMTEELVLPDRTVPLATHQFGDEQVLHPGGHRHLVAFDLRPPHQATWTFASGGVTVRRTLTLTSGANEARLTYEVEGVDAPSRLRVRPLVPLRDFHALDGETAHAGAHRVAAHDDAVRIERADAALRLVAAGAAWEPDEQWWRDFAYTEDRARGQRWREDVFSPGVFVFTVGAGGRTVEVAVDAGEAAAEAVVDRRGARGDSAHDGARARLAAAADQFVVERAGPRGSSMSIIAGYPWFADWGRDAMISLPGLLLATGRHAEARSVLETFAAHLERGLLPNCFDDEGGPALYNTVDAGLWFIHALRLYALASGDRALDALLDAAREIVRAYRRGTGFGIGIGADGLVVAGQGREPLTWMDARRDGVTFTPRDGKPVELSALWHNALLSLADLVAGEEAAELRERAGHTALSMQMSFWWPERACLHDVLRLGEHDWLGDERLRPNQIFAVSLPFSPLTAEQQACVVTVVRDRLLTPYGLRTLDPGDAGYRGRYEGDLTSRDGAYHNGTVWPWLIGAYCDAVLRVGGGSDAANREVRGVLEPLLAELDHGCLGQVAEVYDGDAPHRASGCPAQAWSVAEVLRVLDSLSPVSR